MTQARIEQIILENVHGIINPTTIHMPPQNHNIVIWGGNGSGKSSIYRAIIDFLDASVNQVPIDVIKNKLTPHHDARISMTIQDETSKHVVHSWTNSQRPNDPIIHECRRTFGRLSYNDVLSISFAYRHNHEVEIFQYLQDALLTHTHKGSVTLTALEEIINQNIASKASSEEIEKSIKTYNETLYNILLEVQREANEYLRTSFKYAEWTIRLESTELGVINNQVQLPKVYLKTVRNKELDTAVYPDFHKFMNDALISSIAYSLYFAALKQRNDKKLPLLLLDDIQIGFDEKNWDSLLRIIETDFADYQTILISHNDALCKYIVDQKRGESAQKWQYYYLYRNVPQNSVTLTKENKVASQGLTDTVIDWYIATNHHGQLLADTRIYMENQLKNILIRVQAEVKLPYKDIHNGLTLGPLIKQVKFQFGPRIYPTPDPRFAPALQQYYQSGVHDALNEAHHDTPTRYTPTDARQIVKKAREFLVLLHDIAQRHPNYKP
jgi:hypothetical protein